MNQKFLIYNYKKIKIIKNPFWNHFKSIFETIYLKKYIF